MSSEALKNDDQAVWQVPVNEETWALGVAQLLWNQVLRPQ
jgi:hypothetical protein